MKVAIIGGGAAGFFSAITAKMNDPDTEVVIFEKSHKILSKVKISGGGRCNVTNACSTISELCRAYPRGGNSLKKAFNIFSNHDTMKWFQSCGVPLVVQDDNCVFPASQNSQSIIDCFLNETRRLNIEVKTGMGIHHMESVGERWKLFFKDDDYEPKMFDKVIVATGGSQRKENFQWLEALGHKIENPVPSLFTFNMPDESITGLMGVVVENALVSIRGTKFKSDGPLLITHWGMSGPSILKLSSLAARYLNEAGYDFQVQVNWTGEVNTEWTATRLSEIAEANPQKILSNIKPFALPGRLWIFLLSKCGLSPEKKWGEIGKKGFNKLVTVLTNDAYSVKGKSTFRDEFVTCGGVSLLSVDLKTMQSKHARNLYFAGEVLDIDAITGGFNFQAAWTTGYIAGQLG